jgi:hypothetical protein
MGLLDSKIYSLQFDLIFHAKNFKKKKARWLAQWAFEPHQLQTNGCLGFKAS